MRKKVLFIDRDGTLIVEPPVTFQVDTLDQLSFIPGVIRNLYTIRKLLDFEIVMATNQDGLGTSAYPRKNFDCVQNKMLEIFAGEDITFDNVLIDSSLPKDNSPNRKPRTGMFKKYLKDDYDLAKSYVIGDRETDMELARNLGCKGIWLTADKTVKNVDNIRAFDTWNAIKEYLFLCERCACIKRETRETNIFVELNLDGQGGSCIMTGIGFFDHMLEQIAKHSGVNLALRAKGDLQVDEHHTIEDTAIALGEAFLKALGDKRGIERYGYCLPMDDCLCSAVLDFGGRPWLEWNATFKREKIGDMPTEMIYHFFKSFSDAARMNLHLKAEGENEHHKAEGLFKALARAIKMAIRRDIYNKDLPTTKGML